MARPKRQAACHPDRPHDALGLCHNCYRNRYNATREGRARRAEFYAKNKPRIQAKAKARWRTMHPEVKRVRIAARVVKARANRQDKNWYYKPVPRVPESVTTRKTPAGFADKTWWRVADKEKPRSWK